MGTNTGAGPCPTLLPSLFRAQIRAPEPPRLPQSRINNSCRTCIHTIPAVLVSSKLLLGREITRAITRPSNVIRLLRATRRIRVIGRQPQPVDRLHSLRAGRHSRGRAQRGCCRLNVWRTARHQARSRREAQAVPLVLELGAAAS